jgi:uncharacterized membrane protein YcaP (DUF421 family)
MDLLKVLHKPITSEDINILSIDIILLLLLVLWFNYAYLASIPIKFKYTILFSSIILIQDGRPSNYEREQLY